MKLTCLFLSVFACIIINNANAQVGYIVTQKGDTLKGEVKFPAFGRPKFRPVDRADFRSFSIDTLKEYQLTKDSSIYIVKSIPISSANLISKTQPLQRLEHGKIDLYEHVSTSGNHIFTWYVSKGADSLIALKTSDIFLVGNGSKKDRRQILSDMFADQPGVRSAFDASGKFDFDTIRLYIRKYNQATGGIKN